MSTVDLAYLQDAHSKRRLVPVIGAGLGAATAALPTWPKLLDKMMHYAADLFRDADKKTLEDLANKNSLLDAFQLLQEVLGRDSEEYAASLQYESFLNDVFHNPQIRDPWLLNALLSLRPRVCITTNYDTLLENWMVTGTDESTTWLTPTEMRDMIRIGSGVVHLHGRYDLPKSVILSQQDYSRLEIDAHAEAITQALFNSGVLLFIGTRLGTESDPHLHRLLQGFKRLSDDSRRERYPHVLLVRNRPSGTDIARLRTLGTTPFSYGDNYCELPKFIESLQDTDRVSMNAKRTIPMIRAAARALDRTEYITNIERFIKNEIFPGRQIRVSYAELDTNLSFGTLEARYVQPNNATHTTFSYPVSLAAWSLVEGRIIAWPSDSTRQCDFDRLDNLGRLEQVERHFNRALEVDEQYLSRFIDMEEVSRKFNDRSLALSDFFQDWGAQDSEPRYRQFVSLPVPLLDSVGMNTGDLPQRGVFNIDSLEEQPLLTVRTEVLLQAAAAAAEAAYLHR